MKTWPLFIIVILIFALVCSPVLAISKSELISQYKTGYLPGPTPPTPMPTTIPTTGPTPTPSKWPFPPVPDSYWFRVKGWIFNETLGVNKTLDDRFSMKSVDPGTAIFNNVGKPNIYLYCNHDIIAQVRLAPEYAITVSEPVYQPGKGWQAEIRNGSLNGKGDFLFYEALGSDFAWQNEEGYIIRAASREQDMAFMLGQYGFNEKETLEFIDYWASHLIGDMDFVFYPQETDAVNQDMPLSIIPKPDHVMRIWFYAEPLVSAPEPVTSPERIVREGFYVVEWGVIIDDEYWMNHSPVRSEVLL